MILINYNVTCISYNQRMCIYRLQKIIIFPVYKKTALLINACIKLRISATPLAPVPDDDRRATKTRLPAISLSSPVRI